MTQMKLTCFGLLASACLLAALLVVQIDDRRLLPGARAEMVVNTTSLTFLTTQTQPGEEALFVLDNTSQKLLIYKTDKSRKRVELAGLEELPKLFELKNADAGGQAAPGAPALGRAAR